MRNLTKAQFITLEGIEGSGKTTQLSNIIKYLENNGHSVLATREPGGTEVADRIRTLLVESGSEPLEPASELLLYNASRCQHVMQRIRPALQEGKIVVCDRFTDATVAYQAYGRGLSLEWVEQVNHSATDGLEPNLTLLFDIEPETGLKRSLDRLHKANSKEDRFEQEALSFHQKVRQGYLELAKRFPERIVVIPATEATEIVWQKVEAILVERL